MIGLAGSGASSGLAVGTYEWSASFCLLLLAWIFIPQYLRSRIFTMPEFLEKRFSPGCRWYLTTVSLLAYVLTKISVALFAAGILAREIFGWDYMTTAVLLVIATGIYTITGGLSAVIYTDLLQAFIMVGGSGYLTWLGLSEAGGFGALREALPDDFFHIVKDIDHPEYPWLGTTLGTMILGTWYWCTDQVIVQKTLSARSLPHARGGAIFASALKITPVFILVLPGLIARALWPAEATGDTAFPLLVERLLPPGLSGLMIAALLAALMSSLSSVLNSCSTLVTMDIYKKIHPEASEKRLVYVGRADHGRGRPREHLVDSDDPLPERGSLPVPAERAGIHRRADHRDVPAGDPVEGRHVAGGDLNADLWRSGRGRALCLGHLVQGVRV